MKSLRVIALALPLAVGACVTPSIPVPPPDAQAMTFHVDPTGGSATFSYQGDHTLGGAIVYVYDRNQGKGVIDTFRPDGSVGPTASFPAAAGDDVDVTFQQGQSAQSTCVVLRDGVPSSICF